MAKLPGPPGAGGDGPRPCPIPLQTTTYPNNPRLELERARGGTDNPATNPAMEITSLNFERLFPRIIDAYTRCAFIAIDCEFSGVRAFDTNGVPIRTSLRDGASLTPLDYGAGPTEKKKETGQASLVREEAYRRLRSAAQKYTVLQLGMTFAWIDEGR